VSRRRKIPIALLALLLLAWGAVTLFVLVRDRQEIGGLVGQTAPEDADTLELPDPVDRDLSEIVEGGHLTMLTMTNATSYFIYRGELMGFEFGLLWSFARDHDLALEVEVVDDRFELLRRLNAGEGDVVASQLTATDELRRQVALTEPLYTTDPALVQPVAPPEEAGLPEAVEDLILEDPGAFEEQVEISARLIREPGELDGEEIHVPSHTQTLDRLVELEDRISGDIHIVELGGDVSHEELIREVAAGEVKLTAAPETIARLNQAYYENIAVRPALGPDLSIVWAVRENAPELREALDRWLESKRGSDAWQRMYEKYFVDRRGYRERRESRYLTSVTSELSEWDSLLKENAAEIDWDWRLLAAQTFQESRFDPKARSWAGAAGLLQLMPATAEQFGVENVYDPGDNVAGGARYLAWLERYWSDQIPDPEERLKFVLGSYNAGQGHVQDARRLATKYGDDPTSWDDVSYWLLQKSKREIYTDPVVYFGFVRGLEPVTYVSYILERYAHYLRFVEDPGSDPPSGLEAGA
jgi:membrane-bound lytic murein transglycosylase F